MQPLNDQEFARFQRFLNLNTGIALGGSKRSLVAGRLEKRMRALSLGSFSEYLKRIQDPAHAGEAQVAIDLLTTNETYFFREPKHFDALRAHAQKVTAQRGEFRAWSAACSTGEEPYSIAMVLADCLRLDKVSWRVHATDISTRVLQRARRGHYSLARTEHMPPGFMRRYCLKGMGKQDGTMLVDRPIRERVDFDQLNLNERLPALPKFDVIFLRNVMIYFSNDTKRQIIERLSPHLREDGLFLVGHSETLNGITTQLKAIAPAIYVHA